MSHVHNLLQKKLSPGDGPAPIAAGPVPIVPLPVITPVHQEAVDPATFAEFPSAKVTIVPQSRIFFHTDPRGPAADRFRLFRMRLRDVAKTRKLKKLLITSPLPGDGKSTVILNLASALAERSKDSILVIEADLHHAALAKRLCVAGAPGLAECLYNGLDPLRAISYLDPLGFHLLPAGDLQGHSPDLLQTPAFGRIVESLAARFDWILLDSPPSVPLTDALSIQQHADGTVLVVKAGQTPKEAVEKAVALLGKKNLIATVFNAVQGGDPVYYKYRYERDKGE